MKINNTFKLIIAIAVSELAGIIGSVFTSPAISGWYAGLAKPAINPPAWMFGPVWTTLFALMGIAAFLIWREYDKLTLSEVEGSEDQGPVIRRKRQIKIALSIFLVQLVLNTLWSIIFFGLRNPGAAFVEIIFFWLAIVATIIAFAKISRPAAWLLVPYILWVSFAGWLNYSVWQLNSGQKQEIVFCTQEAKLCGDGSYVGRTGPKCEFSACPNENSNGNLWKTITNSKAGITFQYPEKLTTEYISTREWPPTIALRSESFSCSPTPQEKSSMTEIISQRMVDDRAYCVAVKNEGVAGSVYSSYVYKTAKNDKLVEVSFVLRYSNCANYDQAQSQTCTAEREAFDIDATVDKIVRTVKWENNNSLAGQLRKCLPMSDTASKQTCDALLKQITNFDECVAAGFPIMKSNPPQCALPNDRTFIQTN